MQRRGLIASLISVPLLITGCGGSDHASNQTSPTPQQAAVSHPAKQAKGDHLITPNSVGPVTLGMDMNDVQAALPETSSKTEPDGEGIEWINIDNKGDVLMSILLNEEHAVSLIRVFSPQFHTEQGVAVGDNLQSAADKLGGLNEIQSTEIESREFATFKNAPTNIEFQVSGKDGTAGVYGNDETNTSIAAPSASIQSIWVMED
jgi:hypothetical protein